MKTLTAIICLALLKSFSRIEAFLIDGHHNHNQQAPRSLTPKRCGGGYETKKNPILFASIPSNEDDDLENNDDEGENDTKTDRIIRYLGRGTNSIVRPGVVLVAPEHEYDHYLRRSVVFVYGIGSNEYGEHVTRGVIIDQPTAFTMGEMGGGSVVGPLAENILFRGGPVGNDSATLFHSFGKNNIEGDNDGINDNYENSMMINCGEMIGTSGIYEGGLSTAMERTSEGIFPLNAFKFFFNYVEFTDRELLSILGDTDSDGDCWTSLEIESSFILDSDLYTADCWKYLRNKLKLRGLI